MTKKVVVLLLFLLIGLLGCHKEETSFVDEQIVVENRGINIFDKDKNYLTEFLPEASVRLEEILGVSDERRAAVFALDGGLYYTEADGELTESSGFVSYLTKEERYDQVAGIYLTDHQFSIMDVYEDVIRILEEEDKVMVILLDGFGFYQYKWAKERGDIPFLESLFQHEAFGVYVPVTNAGFAAMITGQTPKINGVHNRSYREVKTESIFGYAVNSDKKAILLEADIKILNTEIEPILHLDMNKNGDIDDEIYESAKKIAEEDYDLVFIHFHGIDDRGHTYGLEGEEVASYLAQIDQYVKELSEIWGYQMILTADHGMDFAENGGYHGNGNAMDMVVPYFRREGLSNE